MSTPDLHPNTPPQIGTYISKNKSCTFKFEVLSIHIAKEDSNFYILELVDCNQRHQEVHELDKFQWEKLVTDNDMTLLAQ